MYKNHSYINIYIPDIHIMYIISLNIFGAKLRLSKVLGYNRDVKKSTLCTVCLQVSFLLNNIWRRNS